MYTKETAEQLITESIAEIASKDRKGLVKILRKNGVEIDESASDEEILTATYAALSQSPSFGVDLKKLIYYHVKDASINETYSNLEGGVGDYEIKTVGATTKSSGSYADAVIAKDKSYTASQSAGSKPSSKKAFKDTGFGQWLISFGKENAPDIINMGVNAINNKLQSKADQKMLQQGIDYKVAETQAAMAKQEQIKARNKWLVPLVVIGGLSVLVIVGMIVYKKSKK